MGLPAAALVLAGVGTAVQAAGTIAAGNAARGAANYQAAQMNQQAGQERATAQRQAIMQHRQATLAASRAQAVSAASGGGATDPTVVNIESNIAGQGEYNALSALFNGEERARGLEMDAGAKRYEGAQARQSSVISAAGSTLMSGGNMLMQKYGNGGPPTALPWQETGNVRPAWNGGGYY